MCPNYEADAFEYAIILIVNLYRRKHCINLKRRSKKSVEKEEDEQVEAK